MSLSLMDVKAKQAKAASETGGRKSFSYLHDLKEELKKVSWTSKAELAFCTKLVVMAIFLFGLGIYVVDHIVKGCLDAIGIIVRLIFGV